jgi:hypothetical protein
MQLYRVNGFSGITRRNVCIVVDAPNDDALAQAKAIAAEATFCTSMALNGLEATVINAEPELMNVLLDANVLSRKFDAVRKQARKEFLAKRRTARKAS